MPAMRSVVLPAYNEAGYIDQMLRRTVRSLERRAEPFEIIVVDNCSTDDTAAIADRFRQSDRRIRVVRHEVNRLYAGSCQTGARASHGDRVFILDSDGQIDPEDIWGFDAALDGGLEVVFGKRIERQDPLRRLVVSKIFWVHARLLIGFRLSDVNTGIRAMTRRFADWMELKHPVNLANPEIYVQARLGGFRVGEVPIRQHKREAGVTSQDFTRLLEIEAAILRYLWQLRRDLRSADDLGPGREVAKQHT